MKNVSYENLKADWNAKASSITQDGDAFSVSYGPDELHMPRVVMTDPKTARAMADRVHKKVLEVHHASAPAMLEELVGKAFMNSECIVFTNAEGRGVAAMVSITEHGNQRTETARSAMSSRAKARAYA